MDAWFHCENPYPFVAQDVLDGTNSVRASLPNKYCDPKVAAQLFEETLDEYLLCDELGLNITSSEHHAGINCLYGASPVVLGIVARQARNIRLLSMGDTGHRPAGSGAGRRGICHGRRHFARAARSGLAQCGLLSEGFVA
jgi:hypothetical protein